MDKIKVKDSLESSYETTLTITDKNVEDTLAEALEQSCSPGMWAQLDWDEDEWAAAKKNLEVAKGEYGELKGEVSAAALAKKGKATLERVKGILRRKLECMDWTILDSDGGEVCGGFGLDEVLLNDLTNPSSKGVELVTEGKHCLETVAAQVLRGGGTLTIVDLEDGEKRHAVDADAFIGGMVQFAKEELERTGTPVDWENLRGDWDADAILQMAVFGEVIYG